MFFQRCHGMTSLIWCARNCNIEAMRSLLRAVPKELVDSVEEKVAGVCLFVCCFVFMIQQSLMTALHYSCHRVDLSSVSQLLGFGADTKLRDVSKRTPLLKALSTTSPEQEAIKVSLVGLVVLFDVCL
jgi:ankyrin repeat protein